MKRSALVVGIVLATGLVAGGAGAGASALSQFSLTFTGKHVADPSFPAGLHHEGRFTASAPFCPSGTAVDTRDVQDPPLWVERTHTCDDGSGSIVVSMPNVTGEDGGSGSWQIIKGSGKYATLRGSGTYTGQSLSGDPADFLSITYQTTWKGLVDFDADPPTLTLTATATKLERPRRTYSVRVALVVRNEEPGARVTYALILQARGKYVSGGSKQGSTTTGRAAFVLKVTPPSAARALQLSVRAADPVGNENTTTRAVRLP